MDIAPIKTQRDYRRAPKRIENLMMAKRGTPEGDHLDVLVTLVEAWEQRHYPLDLPDPVEAIKYHMDRGSVSRPNPLSRVSANAQPDHHLHPHRFPTKARSPVVIPAGTLPRVRASRAS